jgi:hypothetical protein
MIPQKARKMSAQTTVPPSARKRSSAVNNARQNASPTETSGAKRLMASVRNRWLVNRAHANVLPPYWGTLYELARLSDDLLADKLEAGEIWPE